jgi:hypothetical protein
MIRIVVLFIFLFVICADFVIAATKKNPKVFDMCVRVFMIIAFCKICEWF